MVNIAAPKGVTGNDLTRSQWVVSFALVTSLFFTWGFAYGLLDVLNKHFQNVFGITITQSTLIQFAYFGVGYFFWAPIAGIIMRRIGYKKGIHMGLTLYSLGAVFYWPSAKFHKYGGFVGCTCVIGMGLSTLEVAANSYIAVLGSQKYAAARLNFSQGFQGVASFTGPLIASKFFFTGINATSLVNVQWVYLAVAGLGVVLNILFFFTPLPEIMEESESLEFENDGYDRPTESFWMQYRCIFGFIAQFCYVGAQVAVASLAINYMTANGAGISAAKASNLFSGMQATFTVGRFVSVLVLQYVDPALLLTFHSVMCVLFSILVGVTPGWGGVGLLFCLFYFESLCYCVIFTLGTKNLGVYTKRGSGLIVMGVGGGAWYPSAQAALADRHGTRVSYLISTIGYLVMLAYAVGMVISQARQGGFRIRNIDELASKRAAMSNAIPPAGVPRPIEDLMTKQNSEKNGFSEHDHTQADKRSNSSAYTDEKLV